MKYMKYDLHGLQLHYASLLWHCQESDSWPMGLRVSSRPASNCAAWRTAGLGPWHQQSCRGFLLRNKKKHLEVSWNRWFKMDIPIKMDDLGVSYFRNHIKYQHLLATWSTNLRVAGRCRSLVSELEHWLHWLQTDTIGSLRHRSHSKLDKTHIIPVGSLDHGWFLGILDIFRHPQVTSSNGLPVSIASGVTKYRRDDVINQLSSNDKSDVLQNK